MQNTLLIASNTYSLSGPYIRHNFGHKPKAVVVFLEEASMKREDNSWMFSKWANLKTVKGVVFVGDICQLMALLLRNSPL